MTDTSNSEEALLKAIRAYGTAQYELGASDTLARIVNAAQAKRATAPKDNGSGGRDARGHAAKGAGKEYVTRLLNRHPNGREFGTLATETTADGEISVWTLRKELQRGQEAGRYKISAGKWRLAPTKTPPE